MQGKTRLEQVWAGFDTLLLVAVFFLLGAVWFSHRREASALDKDAAQKREASPQLSHRLRSPEPSVDGLRVALSHQRMNTIARAMVDSGWDQSPSTPAVDMRENGKTCDVFFTLPEGIVEDSVRVTVAGDVLTLMMKDDDTGKVYVQRIRIPYGVERSDTLQTVISNDVLRVRICPYPAAR
jgi:HSP20 family molecular chaperone IbpA